MRWLAIEHSTIAYRTDFALYGFTTLAIGLYVFMGRADRGLIEAALLVLAGVGAWTLLEYGLHRAVLHRMLPFRTWHAEHHRRPSAWICTPTIVSAALFLFGIYVPSRVVLGESRATAFTLGILAGYVIYAAVHHALHHAPAAPCADARRLAAPTHARPCASPLRHPPARQLRGYDLVVGPCLPDTSHGQRAAPYVPAASTCRRGA